jgi:hypothetical protein
MLANAKLQPMLATAQPEAARGFYRDTLGLPLVSEDRARRNESRLVPRP